MWALLLVIGAVAVVLARWRRSGLSGRDFVVVQGARVYSQLWHRCRWTHSSVSMTRDGPVLIVANHTCSADPMFIQGGCPRVLSFLVAREHFNVHPLARKLMDYQRSVPIKRNGRDVWGLRQALRRLEEGRAVCLFPEGNLSGVARQRRRAAKPGIALLALVSKAPVYPVYIWGGPSTDRLLDSWLWPSRRAVRVIYGPPVDLSPYRDRPRNRELFEEVTRLLMQKVEELKSPRKT